MDVCMLAQFLKALELDKSKGDLDGGKGKKTAATRTTRVIAHRKACTVTSL
jgi:hypothetical protein